MTVLGAAIGSGEFLLGPAAFVQYGLVILWITGVATILQTVFGGFPVDTERGFLFNFVELMTQTE